MIPPPGSDTLHPPRGAGADGAGAAGAAGEAAGDAAPLRPPGPWDRSELIIERPELQRRGQRALHGTLTALAWVVWGYLWLPLITLVAWFLGVRAFITELVIPERTTLLLTGAVYLAVIAVLGGTLLLWSRYNLRRFRNRSRRSATPATARAEIEEWFQLEDSTFDAFREAASLVVEHGPDGEVTLVRDVDLPPQ